MRNKENWVRNKRQKLRNGRHEYVSSRGKVMAGKKFRGLPNFCCKKCCQRLSNEDCEALFVQFWASADYNVQSSFIAGCVSQR